MPRTRSHVSFAVTAIAMFVACSDQSLVALGVTAGVFVT